MSKSLLQSIAADLHNTQRHLQVVYRHMRTCRSIRPQIRLAAAIYTDRAQFAADMLAVNFEAANDSYRPEAA